MGAQNLVTRVVLADAHGIDHYRKQDPQRTTQDLLMRALANRHRHAILVQVKIPKDVDSKIWKLIENGDSIQALKVLKEIDINVAFPKGYVEDFNKSWQLIPNPKLDPYA